jgi:hypothetical protein
VTGRVGGVVFGVLCALGAASAVGLTVREAVGTAPVVARVTGTHRTADTTTVSVSVRNTTGRSRCVTVRVAARDRSGHDLAAVTPAPALALPAHARVPVTARLTLTARQYAERLYAFYPSERPCGGPESGG